MSSSGARLGGQVRKREIAERDTGSAFEPKDGVHTTNRTRAAKSSKTTGVSREVQLPEALSSRQAVAVDRQGPGKSRSEQAQESALSSGPSSTMASSASATALRLQRSGSRVANPSLLLGTSPAFLLAPQVQLQQTAFAWGVPQNNLSNDVLTALARERVLLSGNFERSPDLGSLVSLVGSQAEQSSLLRAPPASLLLRQQLLSSTVNPIDLLLGARHGGAPSATASVGRLPNGTGPNFLSEIQQINQHEWETIARHQQVVNVPLRLSDSPRAALLQQLQVPLLPNVATLPANGENIAQLAAIARGVNSGESSWDSVALTSESLRPIPQRRCRDATPGSMLVAIDSDAEKLSDYQILVRKQLEFFVAGMEDVESNTQGRKKRLHLGQVGMRCKHCTHIPVRRRSKGAIYYPAKLSGVYQAAQNMATSHLSEACTDIDEKLRHQLLILRERRATATGGKVYWAKACQQLGIYETEQGLRLSLPPSASCP